MKKIAIGLLSTLMSLVAFSQGKYLEYKITSSASNISGNMKTYFQDDNSRVEMDVSMPMMPDGKMILAALHLNNSPNVVYLLDEKGKTYSEFSSEQNDDYKDYPQNDYEVTVIGNEKVNGYNATHVKVKVKSKATEQEMWLSKEISDYASFTKIKSKYTGKENLMKALEAAGAGGFPVRIIMSQRGKTTQLDLVKIETRNHPASLFSLNGYTKTEGVPGLANPKALEEMKARFENMTLEEKAKFIEQLKGKSQQPPR